MRCSLRLPALSALLLAPALLAAAVPARIQAINSGTRVELPRSVSGRAQMATDLGEAPSTRQLSNVTLHFSLTSAQQTALTQLLIDQQNPSSPRYHHWLTPEQFGAQFGMPASDLAKVTQWLTAQGLTVAPAVPSRNMLTFSGTVAQVEQALGTSIHTVNLKGEQHIANVTNPHLPAAVAAVVSGVTGLSDFRAKPRLQHNIVKAATARPNFSSSLSGAELNFLAPADIDTIYDVNPLLTSSINGSGITIAIMGETDLSIPDVSAFRSAAGLAANNPTVALVGPDPGTSNDPLAIAEAQLDVEWSGATAPNASILYVNSNDVLNTSLPSAIDGTVKLADGSVPPIISISFGLCEQDSDAANFDSLNALFAEANAQGQTIVGPGGDSGATDCDYLAFPAADGLAVDFPASSPFVTGVGGTTFNEGTGNYWSTNNATNGGSALSFIPEMVWNDSTTTSPSAGGGGLSIYASKPSWQIGNGVPADFSRDVPDVSFSASPNHDPYLICSGGSCTNGFRFSDNTLNTVGGTSVSTPIFAGMLALVEQKIASRIGNANPILYGLANSTYGATVFHDVTVGNNDSACIQGSPNCPNGTPIGYNAAPGYDLATGWGSVDAFNLANTWLQVTPAGGSSSGAGINPSATTITTSAPSCGISTGSIALSIQVINDISPSPITAVPGGTVQILVDNVAVGTAIVLSNGTASYTLNTSALTSGGHTVSASYSGDTTFIGSKGTLSIDTVSATQPDFSVTPCNALVQVISGGTTSPLTYTVNSFNGFTGSVAFSVSADATLAATYSFSVSPVVIASGAANGTTVLTLTASTSSAGAAKGNSHPLLRSGSKSGGIASTRTFYTAGSGIAVASLLLLTLPRRRRWAALLAAIVSVSMLGAMGCGSSSGTLLSGGGGTGTAPIVTDATPATYNVTVTGIATTATGATLVHSAVLQFKVE